MSEPILDPMMGSVKPPAAPPASETATDTPLACEQSSAMDGEVNEATTIATSAGGDATTVSSRLLDSDPSKFRSLKQVIVIGRPGSGTDGISDALKKLHFRVYDFHAASERYERDFPLWVEAARLRSEGRPYTQSDYDKLIGDFNAIVGAPACFFDTDFIKLYPNVKVILVTRKHDATTFDSLLRRVTSRFWKIIDPGYCGNISHFLIHVFGSDKYECIEMSEQVVREFVREKNLLVIHNFVAWVPLCQFLSVKVPDAPPPELHDRTFQAMSATRPQHVFLDKRYKVRCIIVYTCRVIVLILLTASAVGLGAVVLFKSLSVSYKLFCLLMVRSQIRDVTRLLAVGICGFGAGYCLAMKHASKAAAVIPPHREYQRKPRNGWKKGKQDRERQPYRNENARSDRPILPSWNGVQEDIRKADAEMFKEARKEGQVTFEEWRNGKHVTFNVTHKLTQSGQHVFSGPRKVLSVTEEKIE